jgi:hypothetical protein
VFVGDRTTRRTSVASRSLHGPLLTASDERSYGTFAVVIEPGANPPVRLPWEPSLHAAASGTKEMGPSRDAAAARIVVALVNGTRAPVTLVPMRATVRVTRRAAALASCPERSLILAFGGMLEPGRSQSLATPLGCDLSIEAVYDVDVSVASPSTGKALHLATHAIRVGLMPPPPMRIEDVTSSTKILGGM